ncbi:MAG: DegT/DnrJ/EryC1/StrS family aminotransferase [Thermaurantiacus sp.]
MIPFLDLSAAYRELQVEIDSAVARVLASGRYVLGPEVEAFEAEWAEFCEVRQAVGVSNGLDALILALRALAIGPGDEVIVPSHTFIATWLAVHAVGARCVPVEPDPQTFTIDPTGIEAAITPATRAIMPVHLYGHPADLAPILHLAASRSLAVIEDAAQAHGARYEGRRIGGHGDLVCWSFYPGKNLGALGDAGAITTNRTDLADRVRLLRNYGSRAKYHHEIAGQNCRLDPLQASILRVKLRHLDRFNARRSLLAEAYSRELAKADLRTPEVYGRVEHAWHLYVVRTSRREELQRRLTDAGIETLVHYPVPPHRQPAFQAAGYPAGSLPLAEHLAAEVLSLPLGPHLAPESACRVARLITG